MMTRLSLTTALALGLMAAPVMANEMNKDSQAGTMNQNLGTTGQGSLQSGQTGMQSSDMQNRFSEFDTNNDGAISKDEWEAKKDQLASAPEFDELAEDGDEISRQAWNEHFGQQGVGTTGAGQSMDQPGQPDQSIGSGSQDQSKQQ